MNLREKERWVEESILVRSGVLPLIPVLHIRELNNYIACNMSSDIIDVCGETVRVEANATTFVNLKSAYLQLHMRF